MTIAADQLDRPASDHAACPNCGAALNGAHCQGCGQPAHLHRTVGGLWHDFLHGVLHLDGKLANTLPLLALRPGELTRRYIGGERRRFVSPMGMFLFSVTLLFLAMQVLGLHMIEIGESELVGPGLARVEASLREVAENRAEEDEAAGGFGVTVNTEAGKKVLVGREVGKSVPNARADRAGASASDRARATLPLVRQAREAWGRQQFDASKDGTGNSLLDAAVQKVTKDPALVAYKVQANSYKFSWALIPLSVPFVWLLFFWRRDVGLYDHAVFVTYSLAFVTLVTVLLLVLSRVGVPDGVLATAFVLGIPVHIWTHLRGSYRLNKRSTLWRFLLLSLFIWLAVGLFAVILFALGALG